MNEAVALEIINDMMEVGINVALKAREITKGDFFDFLGTRQDLFSRFTKYQKYKGEVAADEGIHIADTESDLARAKVKILARQWYCAKIAPERFGDRIAIDHNVSVDMRGAIADARARAGRVIDVSSAPETQLLEAPKPREYNADADEALAAAYAGVPRYAKPHESLVEWGGKLVDSLPLASQPIPIDDIDEDIDIFS